MAYFGQIYTRLSYGITVWELSNRFYKIDVVQKIFYKLNYVTIMHKHFQDYGLTHPTMHLNI